MRIAWAASLVTIFKLAGAEIIGHLGRHDCAGIHLSGLDRSAHRGPAAGADDLKIALRPCNPACLIAQRTVLSVKLAGQVMPMLLPLSDLISV